MVAEEPLRTTKLANKETASGLPYRIPPGKRAVTILMSEQKAVAYAINPGNRVDVMGIARECKNPRVSNVALVGALAAFLEIDEQAWEYAIKNTVPRALSANLAAFRMGMKAARET